MFSNSSSRRRHPVLPDAPIIKVSGVWHEQQPIDGASRPELSASNEHKSRFHGFECIGRGASVLRLANRRGCRPRVLASVRAGGFTLKVRDLLSKNPENLTDKQRVKLEWIAAAHPRLHFAYQLKRERRCRRTPMRHRADESGTSAMSQFAETARCRVRLHSDGRRPSAESNEPGWNP